MWQHCPTWLLSTVVILLLAANAINIGADLGAMADASRLVIGGPQALYVLLFGVICVVLQVFLQYTRYVSVLKWLTLFLLAPCSWRRSPGSTRSRASWCRRCGSTRTISRRSSRCWHHH